MGNFATCMQAETRDEAVILRLGRSWAKTRRHTFESEWRWNQEELDSLHRKASCCEVRLGPMCMLAPQRVASACEAVRLVVFIDSASTFLCPQCVL